MTDSRLIWILLVALVFVLFMDDGTAERWCDTYEFCEEPSGEIVSVEAFRKQQDIDRASDLGGRAYQNGIEWHKNPYPVDTDEHKAWIDGWRMERDYWRVT